MLMNKQILLLSICILVCSAIQAQVKLGGEIGFHAASVIEKNSLPGWDTSTSKFYGSKSGIHAGIIVEIPLSNRFFLQPGLNYTSKGRQYAKTYDAAGTAATDTVYAKSTLNLGYMEIPFYFTYKIPLTSTHKSHFFLGAGPYFGFILKATQNNQSLVKTSDTSQQYAKGSDDLLVGNAVNKYKTFDYGVNAKAGFELGNVMLSGYFSQGLGNFYTAPYSSTFHHRAIGATLGIWLGRSAAPAVTTIIDTDKDGIPDESDLCPTKPGLKKYNGCPIPDTDNDGIDDEHDSCRTIPGVARYNGCPVPDTDHDGIDDEHDSCKTIPGVARYNGCPIPDRDGDGINDEEDKCPDVKGVAENNGCPPVKKEIRERVRFVARNIEFATKSDGISPSSHAGLNELAALLKKHPELHLTIEGHTDSVGTAEHNLDLSQRRADAVRNYLLGQGIEEKRLTAMGMGMSHPIANNNTEKGKAKNRRVELKLTTQ